MRADTADVDPWGPDPTRRRFVAPRRAGDLPGVRRLWSRRPRQRARLRLPAARHIVLVAVGGAVGALARAAVGAAVAVPEGGWPWATMAANLTGALLLGLVLRVTGESLAGGRWARPLLGTGVIGSYTTFSTVSLEIARLAAGGRVVVAGGYAAATLVGGLVAVSVGSAAAARLLRLRRGGR